MFGSEAPLYMLILIPITSGVIGYLTNVAAVKMMFYPVRFVGIFPPYLGWQGIVPSNAVALVRNTHKHVMERLISMNDVFAGRSSEEFVQGTETRLRTLTSETLDREANKHMGPMWNALSDDMKAQVTEEVVTHILSASNRVVRRVMDEIDHLIDIEALCISAAKADPTLMNRMFLDVGKKEFIFIERSGLYFGFLFGLVQMVTFALYPAWWVLPFFGLLVGWLTNSMAIRLIFEPREPKRILGLKVQGLFLQRQKEVAAEFGRLVCSDIFSDERLRAELTQESSRAIVMEWVREETDATLEEYSSHPMRPMIPDSVIDAMRIELEREVENEFVHPEGMMVAVSAQSQTLRHEIQTRMSALDPESFENVLRPAFQAEEWKLMFAGAVLGFGAGFLQLIYLFAEAWARMSG